VFQNWLVEHGNDSKFKIDGLNISEIPFWVFWITITFHMKKLQDFFKSS
jgi:hypothetical protein